LRIVAPAKVNLVLRVVGKRPDGYHEVEMIMHSLEWGDVLHVEPAAGIHITCTDPDVPVDERNLVHRAISLLAAATGNDGARVHIEKKIPVAAGVGGGSSDAAAVLLALNQLWNLCWPRERLAALGLALGSDVPYCVLQGPALARGRGEDLTPLPEAAPLHLVLATPRVTWPGPKTATVYRHYRPDLASGADVGAMVSALAQGDLEQIARALRNDLEQAATSIHPVIGELKAAMLRAGARGAVMSGAGATVLALVEPGQAADVARAAQQFTDQVVITRTQGRTP
jgi:4-diphosphocytidyl-2-C-methyl-D-erythritol kinase